MTHPDILMVMNTPSLDKYEDEVQPGGSIFIDSSLITRKVRRTDVTAHYIPATQIAVDLGLPTLANMVLLGALVKDTGCIEDESLKASLEQVIPARRANMLELNLKALQAGKDYDA